MTKDKLAGPFLPSSPFSPFLPLLLPLSLLSFPLLFPFSIVFVLAHGVQRRTSGGRCLGPFTDTRPSADGVGPRLAPNIGDRNGGFFTKRGATI